MAVGDSSYYAGALADLIRQEAIIKFPTVNVAIPLVTTRTEPRADKLSFPVWNTGTNTVTSASIGTHTEGSAISATKLNSDKKTITLDMLSILVPLELEARLSNIDSPEVQIGRIVGAALAAKVDNLVNANYDNFSVSVGSSTIAITVDNLFSAVRSLKDNNAPGPFNSVLDVKQVWGINGLMNDLITSNQFGGSPQAQSDGLTSGFVSTVAGVNLFASPEFTEASNAVKGGVFSREALAFGWASELINVSVRESEDQLKTNFIGWMFAGSTELVDLWGVEMWTKV